MRSWKCGGFILVLLLALPAAGEVHPDCLDARWGVTCHKRRIEDVKALDALFTPVVARTGWDRRCFDVQIIKGDVGGPDSIMVVLHGRKGGSAPACRNPPYEPDEKKAAAKAAGPALLQRLGLELKKAIMAAEPQLRTRLLKNTDAIEMGDGWGGQATIKL